MEQNTKHLIIAGAAIIVVIGLAIALPHLKKSSTTPVTPVVATTTNPTTSTSSAAATKLADWNAMLAKYNGNTVTFAADCTATPVTQAHKKGTTILLVNNSDVSHTVTVGTAVYTVGARHYRTAVLTTTGTTIISCDARTNTANIGVE